MVCPIAADFGPGFNKSLPLPLLLVCLPRFWTVFSISNVPVYFYHCTRQYIFYYDAKWQTSDAIPYICIFMFILSVFWLLILDLSLNFLFYKRAWAPKLPKVSHMSHICQNLMKRLMNGVAWKLEGSNRGWIIIECWYRNHVVGTVVMTTYIKICIQNLNVWTLTWDEVVIIKLQQISRECFWDFSVYRGIYDTD